MPRKRLAAVAPVAEAASRGDRMATFAALVAALTTAIERADTSSVPGLAARLVDVLKRIGGADPSVLVWLRDSLAPAVDRLVELQGEVDDDGKPIPEARALAPTVRQLVSVVEALESMPVGAEVSKADELAVRRRAKSGDSRSAAKRLHA